MILKHQMLFGIRDLAKKNYFPAGSVIVALHTGGLQGDAGMEKRIYDQ